MSRMSVTVYRGREGVVGMWMGRATRREREERRERREGERERERERETKERPRRVNAFR